MRGACEVAGRAGPVGSPGLLNGNHPGDSQAGRGLRAGPEGQAHEADALAGLRGALGCVRLAGQRVLPEGGGL